MLCLENHPIRFCKKFRNYSVDERRDNISHLKYCLNCLATSHDRSRCESSKRCTFENCGGRHHTLLHRARPTSNSSSFSEEIRPSKNTGDNELAPTIWCELAQIESRYQIRVLMRTDQEKTCISQSFVKRHHLIVLPDQIVCFRLSKGAKDIVILAKQASDEKMRELVILPPPLVDAARVKKEISHHYLADEHFESPTGIEVVVGADYSNQIYKECGEYAMLNTWPRGHPSIFGTILSGRFFSAPQ